MSVVVDLGCHGHPAHQGASQDSVRKLVQWFKPAALYGFDPHPGMAYGRQYVLEGTKVYLMPLAAWTYEGSIQYDPSPAAPLSATVLVDPLATGVYGVRCFDLAAYLAAREPVILKMDVEGAEYPLLDHLLATGTIGRVTQLLVEWHDLPARAAERDALLGRLRALPRPMPVEEWT